jgi:hypothetical protein
VYFAQSTDDYTYTKVLLVKEAMLAYNPILICTALSDNSLHRKRMM